MQPNDEEPRVAPAPSLLLGRLSASAEGVLFLLVVLVAILAISELAARDAVLTSVNARLSSLRAEYVERARALVGVPMPSAAASTAARSPNEDLGDKLVRIEAIEDLRRITQTIVTLGGSEREPSLRSILSELNAYSEPGSLKQTASRQSTAAVPSVLAFASAPLYFSSSDQLLALAIMACGAVGAMIASLRANRSFSTRALFMGVASGFVTFLVIKGGRHLFLLQTQGELVAFNPYGSGFAGLIAGLFTERAHQLLSAIVDEFASRLRAAASSGRK